MSAWGIAQAKAQLSEVVHQAMTEGPQEITRSGREVAVVVSFAEWKRMRERHVGETPATPFVSAWDAIQVPPGPELKLPKRGQWRKIPEL